MSLGSHDSLYSIESCILQLHCWRPFHLSPFKTLDSDSHDCNPITKSVIFTATDTSSSNGVFCKKPCLSNRATSFSLDSLDITKLRLFDDDFPLTKPPKRDKFRLFSRKKRRRGSRSLSSRSSDRSWTRRCSVAVSAYYATCSDFPVAPGTDSSGELFNSGDGNWASDISETKSSRREKESGGSDRDGHGYGFQQLGNCEVMGNESGYGSEPGYRGDAEFGYGDEGDEEEDDARLSFWGERSKDVNMEILRGKGFSEQKLHHKGRKKKQE